MFPSMETKVKNFPYSDFLYGMCSQIGPFVSIMNNGYNLQIFLLNKSVFCLEYLDVWT